MSSPSFTSRAVDALRASAVSGLSVTVNPSPPPETQSRTRGVRGRADAAERGIITGDGPGGGITGGKRTVVIAGLPGKMTAAAVKEWLKSFKLAEANTEEKEIAQVEL